MRILLAVDGSASSDRARDLVAALPLREGGRVRIVSVAPSHADLLGLPWALAAVPDAEQIEHDVVRRHRDAIESAEREIRSARSDVIVEPMLLRGRPATVIIEEARAMPADLVVVGHRGHGVWESALLGSVSAEVVDHAPCPVLVARDERLGPIVLADDGSPSARAAETLLTEWPIFTGLPITVLAVAADGYPYAEGFSTGGVAEWAIGYAPTPDELQRSVGAEAASAAERLSRADFTAEARTRVGDPAHEIIALAREIDAGLVVVGTRGQTGLRRLLLGSVARKVVLHATCSVLVVRDDTSVTGSTFVAGRERETVSPFG